MSLEEKTVDDNLARRCEVCMTALTSAEIEVSREAGHPFLCSVHAAEQLSPLEDDAAG